MIDLEQLKLDKRLGLGCSTFGGSHSKQTGLHAMHYAYERGVIYFDVARSYGYGQAESVVGKFAKCKRDKIIIASKFGILPPAHIPFRGLLSWSFRKLKAMMPSSGSAIKSISGKVLVKPVFTPQLAVSSLEKSLKELKTDYIDIYLLHESTYQDVLNDDVKAVLEDAKQKGKIRAWGGTFGDRQDAENIMLTKSVSAMQLPYGMDEDFSNLTKSTDFITIIYSVMNYFKTRNETPPSLEAMQQRFPSLSELKSIAELLLVLAYNELRSGVILLSMTKEEHIDRNLELVQKISLSPSDINSIKMLLA